MNLEDLIKLAGVTKSPYDTPVQEQPTEIEEQPVMDDNEGMRALIALVTPEQLNQLQGNAPVEEEGFANSGDEYAGEPEEYKGTLGSPADLSLRRYLGANGEHVTVDETKVYEDHKVEDINEAWQAYKLNERPSDFAKMLGTRPPDAIGPRSKPKTPSPAPRVGEPVPGIRQPSEPDPIIGPSAGDPVMPGISSANLDGDMPDEPSRPMPAIDPKDLDGDMPATPSQPSMGKDVFGRDKAKLAQKDRDFMKYMQRIMNSATNTDKPLEEEPNEANKFIKAKIDAEKAGEDEFEVNGKKFKVEQVNAYLEDTQESVNEGGMKQAEIEVQDWVKKYEDNMGVNGDSLPEGYLQAMLNTGIMSDAFDQDEYIAFNEKNGYEDDGDWDEDDHDKFMASSPITSGMFSEIRAIQEKYGIDEQGVNDIMGYFESMNRMKTLAGV